MPLAEKIKSKKYINSNGDEQIKRSKLKKNTTCKCKTISYLLGLPKASGIITLES